jgi:thiamine-phosphate pyrophosphorylase
MKLPPFYPIADLGLLAARGVALREYAESLRRAGVKLVQYRNKNGLPRQVLRNAAILSELFHGTGCRLILNDRSDLALLAGISGVHVGQNDLSPEDARLVLGPGSIVGLSTHTDAQAVAAEASTADYIAVGPVFATGTKPDAEPVVGLEGVRRARALTTKPLVAIGGITLANARSVIDAGADSVAVISGLFAPGLQVEQAATRFLEILR